MKRKGLMELAKFDLEPSQVESIYATGTRYVMLADKKQGKLILTIFDAKSTDKTKAATVTFLEKGDYVSLVLDDGDYKWRTGAIYNILSLGRWTDNTAKCWLRTHEELIREFVGSEDKQDPIDAIIDFQNKIMEKRLLKKHKKVTDKIDKQMEIVPELPKDFDDWIDNVPLGFSRYLVYKRDKKVINGFCTYCKKDVLLEHAVHNEKGTCPKCSTAATYKARGKAKRIEDKVVFAIMQNITDHDGTPMILLRYFEGNRDFRGDRITAPETYIEEKLRTFYKLDGTSSSYEYNCFRQRIERWNDENFYFNGRQAILYSKNINEILKGTIWQYSTIDLMAKRNKYFSINKFMEHYPKNPKVEYIVKAGLYNLANDTITGYGYSTGGHYPNYNAKSIREFLGVGMDAVAQLKRLDADIGAFRLLQQAYTKNIRITDKQVLWASNNLNTASYILNATEYTTIHKAIRYMDKQIKSNRHAYSDWLDYLRMCKRLGQDMKSTFVLFPKDLKRAHDEADALIEYKHNEKHDKAIGAMKEELQHLYEFSDIKHCILIPGSAKEIVNESITLRHCVKNYILQVAKGKTSILLVRELENPTKPFYTLEVKDGKVAQCRGYSNKDMTKEVEKFINKFKRAKLSRKIDIKSA